MWKTLCSGAAIRCWPLGGAIGASSRRLCPRGPVFGETMLSVPLAGRRLVAKFDRVVLADDGRAWIFDWKTAPQKARASRLCPKLANAGLSLCLGRGRRGLERGPRARARRRGVGLLARAVPAGLCQPIAYSAAEHDRAGALLSEAIVAIEALPDAGAYAKTDDEGECQRCAFHTYCNRPAARSDDWDIDEDELEWEQIPEAEL